MYHFLFSSCLNLRSPLFLLVFAFFHSGFGQSSEARYNAEVFDDFHLESDVAYGQSVTQGGFEQVLIMDIYYPEDDTLQNRPLIILAHGGYFIFGDKQGFKAEAEILARSGYVVASIDYRLIDVEETKTVSKRAVIDAINDLKAAVRFFNKDFQGVNRYKINPDQIFIGGYSAGAVTSLHYAYATTRQDVLSMGGKELLEYVIENGGIEGQSGNPGYESNVKGVINIAGSIHHAGLIDPSEPILISVHGTDDRVVPFYSGTTGETDVVTEGSGLIHEHADMIGLTNHLVKIEGDGHLARYTCDSCINEIRRFIFENL